MEPIKFVCAVVEIYAFLCYSQVLVGSAINQLQLSGPSYNTSETLVVGSARTTLCGSLAASLTKLTLLVQIRVVSVLSNHLARCQMG